MASTLRSSTGGRWRSGVVRDPPSAADGRAARLEVRDRIDHLPGQHYVVRLTRRGRLHRPPLLLGRLRADDPLLELYVERLDDGEVSPYLADVVEPGDELEVRGPIGGWFVWDG